MISKSITGFPTLILVAGLAGCAVSSSREQSALEDLRAVERTQHEREDVNAPRRPPPPLTDASPLADYLAHAALANPGLEAAFNAWKAAVLRVARVRALPDPRFSYGYFIREVETRVGPQQQKFGLSQTFPWFGKLALRGDVALHRAEAERQRYEVLRRALFHEVKAAYSDLYYFHRAVDITRENIQLITSLEQVARIRYQTDAATHADVIKSQVELGVLEDRLRSLRDRCRPARARLNAALGRRTDASLPVPAPLPEERVRFTMKDLAAWLEKHNPDLRALDALAAGEEAAARLARKSAWPDFTLGVEYIDTDRALMHGTPDSSKDPVVAMISLNLPIWFGKYRAEENEARHRHLAALKRREDRKHRLSAALERAVYEYREAGNKIDLYRNTLIPKATESLDVARQAFIAGKADFLDLIDTQRTLLGFKLEVQRALADRPRRLAEIEMLVGADLPRIPGDSPSSPTEVTP